MMYMKWHVRSHDSFDPIGPFFCVIRFAWLWELGDFNLLGARVG